uniref:Thioredoxin domain-containing protein n=1 Tax=Ciona savignyi TaxID=51511 RepID=H2ZDC0_CIOSA
VIHFWASWAEQCKQMNEVMAELATQNTNVVFLSVEAEEIPEISHKYEIEAVPTFILIKNHQQIGRLNGAHAPELTKLVLLNKEKPAGSMNVQSLPTGVITLYSELIGGLDIVKEMAQEGELGSVLPVQETKQSLKDRIKATINQSKVVLFMKGEPSSPRCGFSRQIVQILSESGVSYSHFDILTDEEIRQGLKKYSDWPTYPQLYVEGELIGGLDIVKELVQAGELVETLKG